jgi:hypothetical protein
VCAFLVLLVVPIVHDEAGCPTTAPHSLTCTAHGMAAAPAQHAGGVLVPYLSDGSSVRPNGLLVVDTLLPSDQIGRSPPPAFPWN